MVEGKLTMHKYLPAFLMLASLCSVTACTSMNREFTCNANTGVGCKSISEVNEMVNTGVVGSTSSTHSIDADEAALPRTVVLPNTNEENRLTEAPPARVSEILMAVWVAPYTDEDDNFHTDQTVYTVIKEGQWQY